MMLLEDLQESLDTIRALSNRRPRIGIVLGSGLGAFVDAMQIETSLPFAQIPNFTPPSIEGHNGRLVLGQLDGVDLAVLQGRIHFYEGHSMASVVFPVRCLAMLGIEVLILTNAAGSLHASNPAGSFLIIEDHINLMGDNPLKGPNIQKLGPRFPDMTKAYDPELNRLLEEALKSAGAQYARGVYCAVSGPTYETPAEIRYLKAIGGDAVGMSTVPESIAANHLGLRVACLSCLTNLAAGISPHQLSHDEVTETAKQVEKVFQTSLQKFITAIAAQLD